LRLMFVDGTIYRQVNRNMTPRLQIGNVRKTERRAEIVEESVRSLQYANESPEIIVFQSVS